MVILVGLPLQLRILIERHFGTVVDIRVIPMKRDGGYRLEPPAGIAKLTIERFSDAAQAYDQITVIVLPYVTLPNEVDGSVTLLEQLGARVARPKFNERGWPAFPARMDQPFLEALQVAVTAEIERSLPPEEPLDEYEREVVVDILRGLASHSKMGPNNHSHEDDMWKSRGQKLGPGGRTKIVAHMMREKFVSRKKNASKGGTGWVYWIDDVALVSQTYPELATYLK